MGAYEAGIVARRVAMDAVREARRDAAAAQRLYGRLSPIIGAFDASEMSERDMAAYGLKRLGQKPSADPVTAVDCYLAGLAHRAALDAGAMDGRPRSFLDDYFKKPAA